MRASSSSGGSKIIDLMHSHKQSLGPFFSFEFFPPKTEAGTENLYLRMERMTSLQPIFVDITWGAGGSTKELTMAIAEYTQTYFGVEALMHLTCTNLSVDEIKIILKAARDSGIQNILALRGDPPKGAVSWEPAPNGLANAIDLVRLIRQEHGDYFGIAVAAFPEGHPSSSPRGSPGSPGTGSWAESTIASDIVHLKGKVDAGADFILTQFFYDPSVFLDFVARCREADITCPILPGMMPIQSFSSFEKMTKFCRTRVPQRVWAELEPIREDDEAVKAYGVKLCVEMCQTLSAAGVPGFHFYTLNLEKSVLLILEELGVTQNMSARRALPWRGSRSSKRGGNNGEGISPRVNGSEDVRPINWANRPKSYIKRTVTWDEFPNGRWGDGRSPAFGELSDSHFFRPTEGSKEDRLAMWGEAPVTPQDVYEVFAKYVEGRIPILPWCESRPQAETRIISDPLAAINRAGFLTINSQPAVNAEASDHTVFGWGGPGGRVYQKAYVEFFAPPDLLKLIMEVIGMHPSLTFNAVDSSGNQHSSGPRGVTALTWGVFPSKEILQPTVFDSETFLVWSQEAFQLWTDAWASLYDDETESSALLYDIHDTYYLVAIIDNEYIDSTLYQFMLDLSVLANKRSAEGGKSDETDSGAIGFDE